MFRVPLLTAASSMLKSDRPRLPFKNFSTTSTPPKTKTKWTYASIKTYVKDPTRLWNNRKLRKVIRLGRIVGVVFAVGMGGVQYGMITVAKDPRSFDLNMVSTTLASTNTELIVAVSENEPLHRNGYKLLSTVNGRTPFVMQKNQDTNRYDIVHPVQDEHPMWISAIHTQRVFHRIKESAHDFAYAMVQEIKRNKAKALAEQAATANGSSSSDANRVTQSVSQSSSSTTAAGFQVPFKWLNNDVGATSHMLDSSADGNLEHWELMENQLRNEWKIILTDNLAPNAFVHGLLPKRVFVNIGLLNHFCRNDDQLAAVLGHELSHVLLKHSENQMLLDLMIGVSTAAIISVLDFTGLFGLIFEIGAFSKLVDYSGAAFSRCHENEADQLGEYIATTACYQPEGAINVWKNATVFEQVVNDGEMRVAGLLDR